MGVLIDAAECGDLVGVTGVHENPDFSKLPVLPSGLWLPMNVFVSGCKCPLRCTPFCSTFFLGICLKLYFKLIDSSGLANDNSSGYLMLRSLQRLITVEKVLIEKSTRRFKYRKSGNCTVSCLCIDVKCRIASAWTSS